VGRGYQDSARFLANRAGKKNQGPLRQIIVRKSRNSCRARGGEVGAEGMSAMLRSPETKYSAETTCFDAGKIGFCHCAADLQTQVPKLCTDPDLGLLYILILRTYSNFAQENNFLALGVCSPQPCSSAGRRFATSRSRLQNYRRIVSFSQQKFR